MSVRESPNESERSTSRKEHSEAHRPRLARQRRGLAWRRRDQGEARLVESARSGDKHAVGELYQRHVDLIYRYIYARVRDVTVAEDLTAQVFLKALEGFENYQPTGAPFRAWLYRIAHARTVDHWRQQERRQEVLLVDTLPARDPLPEDIVIAKSEWSTALDLLTQLTDDQRDVIILRFIEEMSLADVAETLGKTVGAIKALQHRALASLARLLQHQTVSSREQDD